MRLNLERGRIWSIVRYPVIFLPIAFVVGIGTYAYLYLVQLERLLECDLTVHRSIPSPDGNLSAVIFEMECGATVAFNTRVSIAPADGPFSPKKNPAFLWLRGQHDLAVRWIGENVIEVGIPEDTTIYRNDASVGDITVEYR